MGKATYYSITEDFSLWLYHKFGKRVMKKYVSRSMFTRRKGVIKR